MGGMRIIGLREVSKTKLAQIKYYPGLVLKRGNKIVLLGEWDPNEPGKIKLGLLIGPKDGNSEERIELAPFEDLVPVGNIPPVAVNFTDLMGPDGSSLADNIGAFAAAAIEPFASVRITRAGGNYLYSLSVNEWEISGVYPSLKLDKYFTWY